MIVWNFGYMQVKLLAIRKYNKKFGGKNYEYNERNFSKIKG